MFAEAQYEHARPAGYVTCDDSYTWVWAECFPDFKDEFGWQVERVEAPGGRRAAQFHGWRTLDAGSRVGARKRSAGGHA